MVSICRNAKYTIKKIYKSISITLSTLPVSPLLEFIQFPQLMFVTLSCLPNRLMRFEHRLTTVTYIKSSPKVLDSIFLFWIGQETPNTPQMVECIKPFCYGYSKSQVVILVPTNWNVLYICVSQSTTDVLCTIWNGFFSRWFSVAKRTQKRTPVNIL